MPTRPSLAFRALALAGGACLAALLANRLAPPARRLAWISADLPTGAGTPRPVVAAPPPAVPSETRPRLPLQPLPPPPSKPGRPTPALPGAAIPQAPVARSPIREITGQEAWAAFQAGAPFLDARRSAEFASGHIAKAWCTPVWESDLEDRLFLFKAARRPGPDDPIVIYCSGGDCRDSHLLAEKLLSQGYFHLLIYRDGYPDWVAQGHPLEQGQP